MKNLIIINTVILFGAFLFYACSEKFLDAEPITVKTDINYYTTPAEAQEALVGCYDGMQLIWSDGVALPIAAVMMADLCYAGTGTNDPDDYRKIDEFDKLVAPGFQNLYEKNWEFYYKALNRCNTLILKIEQIEWGNDTSLKAEIEGEARFLRAYLYFDMVRMWERIPLLKEPTVENVPQEEDPDKTYELITGDLLFAIDNCNSIPYGSIEAGKHGHANRWAAEALLARVYLYYTGYYNKSDLVGLVTQQQALDYLEDVIEKSGYELLDNYADLWPAAATYEAARDGKAIANNTYAGETNKEVVFAIKYTYTSDYDGNTDGNHWMVMNGLRKVSEPKYGYGKGWGACTVIPEVYLNWDPADDRCEASILAVVEEGVTFTEQNIKDVKEYTGYFTKKYIPTCDANGDSWAEDIYGGANFMVGQFQDYFSIRYADVLLMAAELGSPDALLYLNMVHTRSCPDTLNSVDKDIIFEERRLEFAFEGIRYYDLLRYDHTLQYAADKVSIVDKVLTNNIEIDKKIDGQNLINTRGLFQIPNNQITLTNGVLKQNPGW
ncbi:MAG: RagB/SusD family nutrient uptake outer membrane protein [Bacteroidales bacterium]|nr:RagB/SusD family nutrient uptake outer membrane protein [Bacteroidales bacterium]